VRGWYAHDPFVYEVGGHAPCEDLCSGRSVGGKAVGVSLDRMKRTVKVMITVKRSFKDVRVKERGGDPEIQVTICQGRIDPSKKCRQMPVFFCGVLSTISILKNGNDSNIRALTSGCFLLGLSQMISEPLWPGELYFVNYHLNLRRLLKLTSDTTSQFRLAFENEWYVGQRFSNVQIMYIRTTGARLVVDERP